MVGIGLNSANALYDPECKLRKYLQGGKIEQSGEWHFEYDKDGQFTEKYKGSGKVVGHEAWTLAVWVESERHSQGCKVAKTKTEALRIIEDMHEKHVVGYKSKR